MMSPLFFYGERVGGSLGVHFRCATDESCFKLDGTKYIAIDGFILEGGSFGIRAEGNFGNGDHQVGVAMLNNRVLPKPFSRCFRPNLIG